MKMSKFATRLNIQPSRLGSAVRSTAFGIEDYSAIAIDTACDLNMIMDNIGCEHSRVLLQNSIDRLFLNQEDKVHGFAVGVESYTTSVIDTGIGNENFIVKFFVNIWEAVISFIKRLWNTVVGWFTGESKNSTASVENVPKAAKKAEDSKREIVKESRTVKKKADDKAIKNAKENASVTPDTTSNAPEKIKPTTARKVVAAAIEKQEKIDSNHAKLAASIIANMNKPVTMHIKPQKVAQIVEERKRVAKEKLDAHITEYVNEDTEAIVDVILEPEKHLDYNILVPYTSKGYLACFDIDNITDSEHITSIIKAGTQIAIRDIATTARGALGAINARINSFQFALDGMSTNDFEVSYLKDCVSRLSSPILEENNVLSLDNVVSPDRYTKSIKDFITKVPEVVVATMQNDSSIETLGELSMYAISTSPDASNAIDFDVYFPVVESRLSPMLLPSISQDHIEELKKVDVVPVTMMNDAQKEVEDNIKKANVRITEFSKRIGTHLEVIGAAVNKPIDKESKAKRMYHVLATTSYAGNSFSDLLDERASELGIDADASDLADYVFRRFDFRGSGKIWDNVPSDIRKKIMNDPNFDLVYNLFDENLESLLDPSGGSIDQLRANYNDIRDFVSRDLAKIYTGLSQDASRVIRNAMTAIRFIVTDVSGFMDANAKATKDFENFIKDVSKNI